MRDRLKKILEKHCAVAECKAYSQDCTAEDCASCLADTILADGWIRPPCEIGDEINGEIVHEVEYSKNLLSTGEIRITKKIHTCYKEDVGKTIFCSHPMTWEEAEKALKEGVG